MTLGVQLGVPHPADPRTSAHAGAAEDSAPAAPEGALLEIDDLTVSYGSGASAVVAVNAVSARVARGERIAVVGESGSGKTTLALAIAGFLDPAVTVSGSVRFDGRDLGRAGGGRRPRLPPRTPGVSMMFQDAMTSLDPVWSVGSQLADVLRTNTGCSRREARVAAGDWVTRVGLRDTARVLAARPYELSGGMRQRVMLALALAGRPRLVIADEPTSALDASTARAAMDLLTELTMELGTAVIMVSHDIHLCAEYSDRTLVMYRGDLVGDGPSDRLDRPDAHPYVRGLLRCVPTLGDVEADLLPTLEQFVGSAAPA
ncbi:ABC transporter ATP-binding protein [Pseudonocardia sp. WMMC193]|uniref:ATP-binding cassette domain-containing protein n=1 Tax=Pseudonocardia sp. WMMC193 TaxID=2911965 RepID=UPI001F2F5D22|nr:ABC transporter ATP-binding protein [Pseudonocardia sp. WMMC193]MCF7549995.1 ABC transporter ATP-binding protein [Pseudonocardia sp. WMMC193]